MDLTQDALGEKEQVRIDNLRDGEEVHQRCVLLTGQLQPDETLEGYSETDYILITIKDSFGRRSFPTQSWPVAQGRFKALVLLSSGPNLVTLEHYHGWEIIGRLEVQLRYTPLTQLPPLHLAIMVAKDSPLIIDCPPSKQRGISSAHADLDAAIAKLRMTAYMWQAMTAEDMRQKGLGRRSFRLEEEWAVDTVSRQFVNSKRNDDALYNEGTCPTRLTAKVHTVRTNKTVAELRDVEIAQQNESGSRRDDLHSIFSDALKEYGGPFQSFCRPVVAGLILDSTYSIEKDLILGHAALGSHNSRGLSLGIFGSHLTYSWPRFLEEVSACLLDTTPRDDCIGNDNGECTTAWEACAVSQGAMLHEVGHAFGAGHTTGIMARGYSPDWTKNFLPFTAYSVHKNCRGRLVEDANNDARWALCDALLFSTKPHFQLPSDTVLSSEARFALSSVQLLRKDDESEVVAIENVAGIACIAFNGIMQARPTVAEPQQKLEYPFLELKNRFGEDSELSVEITAMNGNVKTIRNLWKFSDKAGTIRIPGTVFSLQKKAVAIDNIDDYDGKHWEWAVLLHRRKDDGKLSRATSIDMRVGLLFDGAVVYYDDNETVSCGPRKTVHGYDHTFGGHASETITIPKNVDIRKVAICRSSDTLWGMRTYLTNGDEAGELNEGEGQVEILEPPQGQKIIGFYGRSKWPDSFMEVDEFGIIMAPTDVKLPMTIYDMPELQNTDGGVYTD